MQGGIHPDFTGADYLEILKAAKAGAEVRLFYISYGQLE
jgi:hypothetical protein